MSKRMTMAMSKVASLQKKAASPASVPGLVGSAGGALCGDVISSAALLALVGMAGIGGAAGVGYAKLTSKSKADLDTVAKEYQDARLSADIVNLEQKLQQESAYAARKKTPKTMRIA